MKILSTFVSFLPAFLAFASFSAHAEAREPLLSVVGGVNWNTPYHAATFQSDYGWRGGLGYSTAFPVGELVLPLELDLILRTAVLKSSDRYDRNVFTDLQAPVIFHGAFSRWKKLEAMAMWVPSYTLDMVSISSDEGRIAYTKSLRTRFNMGFGGGLQVSTVLGIRLRSYWVYNIFSAFPASQLTFSDFGAELAIPLMWKQAEQ